MSHNAGGSTRTCAHKTVTIAVAVAVSVAEAEAEAVAITQTQQNISNQGFVRANRIGILERSLASGGLYTVANVGDHGKIMKQKHTQLRYAYK